MTEENNLLPDNMKKDEMMDTSIAHHRHLNQGTGSAQIHMPEIQDMQDFNAGNGKGNSTVPSDLKYTEITKDKPIRLQVKVLIPVKEHPRFNFVGKLLGPKGNSLKRLQEETMTKMAILGRGSMRDKAKEEELRKQNDPKHAHLAEDLHVEVNAFAPPAEAYGRISHALSEIKKFLVPDDNDEIRQTQLQELAYINGGAPTTGAPGRSRGRGGAPPPPLGGPAPARTARAGLLATPPPGLIGVSYPWKAPRAITTRPGAGGPMPGRGVLPPSRSSANRVPPPLPRLAPAYRPVAEPRTYDDDYDYPESYDQRYADEEGDGQYYEYPPTGTEPYDAGYAAEDAHYSGGDDWRQSTDAPRMKAAAGRATTRGAYRDHPYAPPLPPPPPPPPIPQVSRY